MSGFLAVLNGWPGAGKSTVGQLLACRTAARFLPNHVLCAPASALSDIGSPNWSAMRDRTLEAAWDLIGTAGPAGRYVATNVVTDGPDGVARVRRWQEAASQAQVLFLWVTVICDLAQNRIRLAGVGRADRGSLVDPAVLQRLREGPGLLQVDSKVPQLVIDVTDLAAEVAAETIRDALYAHGALPFRASADDSRA